MSHLNGKSLNIKDKNIEKLVKLFPEVNTDGKIDFEKLKQILGDYVDDSEERYRFVWNGKGESLRLSQTPSMGTLRPAKEEGESKNWDETENLYIEGDNLEVLKLLQKSYFNKVKMIYIDPPYNTGNDFIYTDNFKDNIQNYKQITGQVDSEGNATTTNREYSGRYHTDWLNMIYPRLRLARNLLKDDGVIFISIDDHEVVNLRKTLDEIFGEDNQVATVANIANPKGRSDSKFIATGHEYILIYAKDINLLNFGGFELDEKITKRYNKIDEHGRKYRETDLKKGGFGDKREDRPAMYYYFIFDEKTGEFYPSYKKVEGKYSVKPIRADGTDGRWRWGFDNSKENLDKLLVRWMPTKNQWGVFEKDYLDKRNSIKAPSYWSFKDVNNERGVESFINYGFPRGTFDNPKPIGTLKRALTLGMPLKDDDYVLDFFSGSSTTADAIMQLNAEDNGNRKFIMIQLPEAIDEKSEAYKDGHKNISDIGKERIRRAGEKIKSELQEKYETASDEERKELKNPVELDIGFKVFKLDSSNIKEWNPGKYENVQQAIEDALTPYVPGRTEEDVVYEMMLKMGLDLTYPVEEIDVNGKTIYSIGYGFLMICLADKVDIAVAEKMIEIKDKNNQQEFRAIFRDEGFSSDTDKTNVKETLRSAGLAEESFITL